MTSIARPHGPSLASRLAFRFLVAYVALFLLAEHAVGFGALLGLWGSDPLFGAYAAFGRTLFGVECERHFNGSGDTSYHWVRFGSNLLLATAATAAWAAVDRCRPNHPRLRDGLWIALRFLLATTMLSYGLGKFGDGQFSPPIALQLLQPMGQSSPMGLLWFFMGSSAPYTAFTGVIELAGAFLLAFRRTQLLGALWTAAAMANVFALNLCYDVPAKILSFHLLAFALVIASPDAARLARMFVRNVPVPAVDLEGPWTRPSLRRFGFGCKVAWLGLATAAVLFVLFVGPPHAGQGGPEAELRATWEVAEFRRDGVEVPPLTTDATRWGHVAFVEDWPMGLAIVKPMTGDLAHWFWSAADGVLTLHAVAQGDDGRLQPGEVQGALRYTRDGDRGLRFDGELNGARTEVVCKRIDREDFPLVQRGFRWVSERPFNR